MLQFTATPAPSTSGTDANVKTTSKAGTTPNGHAITTTTTPPPPPCVGGWSSWINHNNPSSGTGDREQLTEAEKLQLCSGGNLTRVECHVVDGDIPSYSSGEVAECSVDRGFTCNNADNFPIPCSDYKARFYCECPGMCLLYIVSLFFFLRIFRHSITKDFRKRYSP